MKKGNEEVGGTGRKVGEGAEEHLRPCTNDVHTYRGAGGNGAGAAWRAKGGTFDHEIISTLRQSVRSDALRAAKEARPS